MAAKKQPKKPSKWAANYYIPKFGHVSEGEQVSKEALEAWKAIAPKGSEPKISE